MVKHNNVVPNIHCHKKWATSSRGPLKVKLKLNEPAKKKKRRLARAARAAQIAPRPLKKLRPIVFCPTQKYSHKSRLGRGFTLEEVRAAGISPKYAKTIGIAVDHRRYNKSEESLARNLARLQEYLGKLIVFPRRRNNKPKNGDSSPEELKEAKQWLGGQIQPIEKKKTKEIVMMKITDEMKEKSAFNIMRCARVESRIDGHRASVKNRKKD